MQLLEIRHSFGINISTLNCKTLLRIFSNSFAYHLQNILMHGFLLLLHHWLYCAQVEGLGWLCLLNYYTFFMHNH